MGIESVGVGHCDEVGETMNYLQLGNTLVYAAFITLDLCVQSYFGMSFGFVLWLFWMIRLRTKESVKP